MIALYVILSIILLIFILLHFSVVLYVDYTNNKLTAKAKYLFFTIYPLKEKKTNKKRQARKNKRKKKRLEKELAKEKAKVEKINKKQQSTTVAANESINKTIHETVVEINPEEVKPENKSEPNLSENNENKILSSEDKTEEDDKENKLFSKLDDFKDKWEDIKPYIPLGKKSVKKLIKSIRITDLTINIAVADEDAYECALLYGKMNGIVYGLLGIITRFLTVSIKKVNISAKYNSPESEYSFSGNIKTRPSTIIALAVFILFKYIYTKLKLQKQKNETEM